MENHHAGFFEGTLFDMSGSQNWSFYARWPRRAWLTGWSGMRSS